MIGYFLPTFSVPSPQAAACKSCDPQPFHLTHHLLLSVFDPCSQGISLFWVRTYEDMSAYLSPRCFQDGKVANGRQMGGKIKTIVMLPAALEEKKIIAFNVDLCSSVPFSLFPVAQFAFPRALPPTLCRCSL